MIVQLGSYEIVAYVYDVRDTVADSPGSLPLGSERRRGRPDRFASIPFEVRGLRVFPQDQAVNRRPLYLNVGYMRLVDVVAALDQATPKLHVKWLCTCGASGRMRASEWQTKGRNSRIRGPFCEYCAGERGRQREARSA